MNYDVIGIGNALVDIEVQVDDSFLEQNSLAKGGMTLSSPEQQLKILEALSDKSTKNSSGGSAANTIHGISVLGGKSYYLGRVANDSFGVHYTKDMQHCGVGFPGPGSEQEGTGTCVILVTPDCERTMFTHLGVSSALHPDNVDDTIVQGSKVVYIEGYLWTGDETREAAHKLAHHAKSEGLQVALSLSDPFIVNSYKEQLTDFIRSNVDILFCNEVEAKSMAETSDPSNAFDKLQALANTVFLTLGKKGSWAGKASETRFSAGVFPVQAVDTTGAGDLYAAGALYGLVQGKNLQECAVLGAYCSSQVVTQLGGRMPMESQKDMGKILKLYNDINPPLP